MKTAEELIQLRYNALCPFVDERVRRLWAASEALAYGHGGASAVARASGISRPTILAGVAELSKGAIESIAIDKIRVRRVGGGRKPLTKTDPRLITDLEALVEPTTRGDPESPLRWTCKSTRSLARQLQKQGHSVSHQTVCQLLQGIGYSLQANRKVHEGVSHPDRNAQFEHISQKTNDFQNRGQPVISVDTKKKELLGNFKNGGQEWQPIGHPTTVNTYDFQDPALGKAIPYGVYDIASNEGWVNVGVDHDTPEFAVESIRRWWNRMGCVLYPSARELLLTADGGGSNGSRSRLWKLELQKFADEAGLKISVCHFPPGTSKWNKIEHRMFCHITENWRGRPLKSLRVVVNLIANTRTQKGLRIFAGQDKGEYPTGKKVSDEELAKIKIQREDFHGEWNYHIAPRGKNEAYRKRSTKK